MKIETARGLLASIFEPPVSTSGRQQFGDQGSKTGIRGSHSHESKPHCRCGEVFECFEFRTAFFGGRLSNFINSGSRLPQWLDKYTCEVIFSVLTKRQGGSSSVNGS